MPAASFATVFVSSRRRRLVALLLVAVALVLAWLRHCVRSRQARLLPAKTSALAEPSQLAKPSITHSRRLSHASSSVGSLRHVLPASTDCTGFAAFLSHYKAEAATEARWLQQELEVTLGQRAFLDSDDLLDLSKLRDHVKNVHEKISDRHCPYCSYATYKQYNLKLHITKVHMGGAGMEKQACPHCDKETTNLEHHLKIYHAAQPALEQL